MSTEQRCSAVMRSSALQLSPIGPRVPADGGVYKGGRNSPDLKKTVGRSKTIPHSNPDSRILEMEAPACKCKRAEGSDGYREKTRVP
jgi:hypothetical protein